MRVDSVEHGEVRGCSPMARKVEFEIVNGPVDNEEWFGESVRLMSEGIGVINGVPRSASLTNTDPGYTSVDKRQNTIVQNNQPIRQYRYMKDKVSQKDISHKLRTSTYPNNKKSINQYEPWIYIH